MEWHFGPTTIARHVHFEWVCPQCNEGRMVSNGGLWPTATPGYHHQCDKCGHAAALSGVRYPQDVKDEIVIESSHKPVIVQSN